jgi:hypothetical protein
MTFQGDLVPDTANRLVNSSSLALLFASPSRATLYPQAYSRLLAGIADKSLTPFRRSFHVYVLFYLHCIQRAFPPPLLALKLTPADVETLTALRDDAAFPARHFVGWFLSPPTGMPPVSTLLLRIDTTTAFPPLPVRPKRGTIARAPASVAAACAALDKLQAALQPDAFLTLAVAQGLLACGYN